MSKTFPSTPVSFIDFPNPENFSASFVYNFYEEDESVAYSDNEKDVLSKHISFVKSQKSASDSGLQKKSLTKLPRYVLIKFNPTDSRIFGNFFKQDFNINSGDFDIEKNLEKILSEDNFDNDTFMNIISVDDGKDDKAHQYFADLVNMNNESQQKADSVDVALKKANLKSDKDFYKAVSENQKSNVVFAKKNSDKKIQRGQSSGISALSDVRINNKFSSHIIENSLKDSRSLYTDELFQKFKDSKNKNSEIDFEKLAGNLQESDYDSEITPLNYRIIKKGVAEFKVAVKGYIIQKYVYREKTNEYVSEEKIILNNKRQSGYVDHKVLYGSKYAYDIRTIYIAEIPAISDQVVESLACTILIASNPAPRVYVNCIEEIPPDPPSDFTITWDFKYNAPFLFWNFPINPQKDIVKFQVFRRFNLLEPFQLIKEYDFDKSAIKYDSGESPDVALVEKVESSKKSFRDFSLSLNDEPIYAITAVDAHGMSSNYSRQIKIKYDARKNILRSQSISEEGAPKAYPNIKIDEPLFDDNFSTSSKEKLIIYFNPDYYNVYNDLGDNLDVLVSKEAGEYYVNLLNLDFQQSQVLTIQINDLLKESK